MGSVGVVLLMLSYSGPIAANAPLKAIAAGLLGAVLYGLAINLTAAHLYKVSGVAITTGSLLFSSIMLLPFAYWQMPDVSTYGFNLV